ncbi:DUF6493 family protein [Kitasatospora sp. NPDC059646]|uniref:DUF6493 family protein n=1 Tax=Kitasatospora sp. NPDC059646 TaxID=3346893 RepID=UPI00367B249F
MTDSATAAAVRRAGFDEVARLIGGLTPQQRRAELPGLKALRRDLREGTHSRGGAWTALLVAGAVCHTAPSGAAAWIASPDFEDVQQWHRPPLRALLDAQDADWQREVALRLARRPADRDPWGPATAYRVAEHLLRACGSPPPAEPGFVADWMTDRGDPRPRHGEPALPPGTDLYRRLAQDSFTPVLAPHVFDADTARQLSGPWAAKDDEQRWPAVLARLAEEGTVDRGALIARGYARLVRGGGAGELRSYLAAVRRLDPTEDELAANVRALTALLDAASPLAGHAQDCLIALDRAGRLDDPTVAEAAEALLARPEKKLVRTQLAWLDRVAKRAPELALRAAARCYAHPDRQLQGQALKLTGRHVGRVPEELAAELRAAARSLDPVHAEDAARLLGLPARPDSTPQEHDRLPEPPRPVSMPAPLGTPAEVAEELAAALAGDPDGVVFERVLDGLVRHAWHDRDALAAALAPVLDDGEWRTLGVLAGAVTGALHRQRARRALTDVRASPFRTWDLRGGVGELISARLEEAAWQLTDAPVPLLLATPTDRSGALDPAALAARIHRYEELGLRPGPVDLAQALLRTAPDGTSTAVADHLTSPAGARLAAWLRAGGLPRQATVPVPAGTGRSGLWKSEHRRYCEQPGIAEEPLTLLGVPGAGAPGAHPDDGVPTAVRTLLGRSAPFLRRAAVEDGIPDGRWPAVLPHHREETAARLIGQLAESADPTPVRGHPLLLPLLAEAAGPCGLAVHQALAYGLGAADAEDRTAVVDALLAFAAQDAIDAELLGRETGELLRTGAVKPNRLAATAGELTEAGAPGLAWAVLSRALPALLAGRPPAGAAALLTAAVDCARRTGARGAIPEVTAAAEAGGRSRLVAEATALAALLAG